MFSANRYIHQHQKDVSRALVSKVKHQKDNFLHDRAGKSPKTTEHFHSIRDYWTTIQEKERKICVCKTRSLNNYFTQFFGRHYNSLTRIQRNDITLNQTVALRVWILEDFCATQKILMAILNDKVVVFEIYKLPSACSLLQSLRERNIVSQLREK